MNCISKVLQNGYVDSLIHGLALGKKLVKHQILRVKESDQHCLDIWPNLPHFLNVPNVLGRLNTVSPNACCCISYVSVAILPSFWQNLMQTHCSFNTSATRSSGMWRKEMLPSILHGCHFDTISSFSKNVAPYIFDQTSYFNFFTFLTLMLCLYRHLWYFYNGTMKAISTIFSKMFLATRN
jgi:hypothetical protein